MGNMSNPNVNRWGRNLFWRQMWTVDKNYASVLHQNKNFLKLINTFLMFGVLHPVNIFMHRRWYETVWKTAPDFFNEHVTRYYRIMYFKDAITGDDNTYFERTKIKALYDTKVWLLRYQNWIVFLYFYFQPVMGIVTRKRKKKKYLKDYNAYGREMTKNLVYLRRLKYIVMYFNIVKNVGANTYFTF